MIPSRAALSLLGLLAVLGLAAGVWEGARAAWAAAALLLMSALVLDAWRAWRAAPLHITRSAARSLALGTGSTVRLRVENSGLASARLLLHDCTPLAFVTRDLPLALSVPPRSVAMATYAVRAVERGIFELGRVDYRRLSPWRLWWRQRSGGMPEEVRVYPNFREVARYAVAARSERLETIGIHRQQRRGEGTDFHQLREYRFGDSLRQIDWSATSRLRKTISREYHDERDQQVVFLLDCGRRMRSRDGELSHLDHALKAVLLLSYVALRQGDAVGLMTMGQERRWLAPAKGPGFIKTIMNTIFDIDAAPLAFDAREAVQQISLRVEKRSLIIVVTNIRDDPSRELHSILSLARRRHVILLASLRERVVRDILSRDAQTHDQALAVAAAHRYLADRAFAHKRLLRTGIEALDVEPQQLPARLVNRYLALKASGVL